MDEITDWRQQTWAHAWNTPTWFEQSQEEWEQAHLLYCLNLIEKCKCNEYDHNGHCKECGRYNWLADTRPEPGKALRYGLMGWY